MQPSPEADQHDEGRARKVRRFATVVTVGMIVLCNGLLLVGLRLSGVNLDELVKTPDFFNAKKDVCLRLTWERVAGATEPVRLCSEWINLADPSGKPHQLASDIKVRQGPDGRYYFDHGIRPDFRLLGLAMFVGAVLLFGMWTRRYLVSRYRLQLGTAGPRSSSILH